MESAGTTAPQCCELYFNYFTVLLTGSSSKMPGFTIVGFKRAHDCAYRQKESAPSEKGRGADISNCVCKKQVLSRLEGILNNPNW